MKISLEGQVILVTGASRGIGAAIAMLLAEAGASVALHYASAEAAAREVQSRCGPLSQLFQADLRSPHAAKSLAEAVLAHYGRVDALVNNAGMARAMDNDPSPEAWQRLWVDTLQVNLVAAAQACDTLLPHMIARGNGRLIHIASRAAFRGDTPDYAAYAASKGGLVAYSRTIARGYGKQGIKSFVVAPGFTQTDMAAPFIQQYGPDYVTNDLALSELTAPKDIAPTVLFLASGWMDHATGCTIDINAGSYVR